MKKIILSLVVILAFGFYLYYQSNHAVAITPISWTQSNSSTKQTSSVIYKDGAYTGQVADAFYGNIQVKAIITSGKISDVEFLEYPNDRQTSEQINTQAMPILTKEAIQVQNSQVDIVTGATQSSEAFQKSLQSALDQAKS